MDGVFSVQQRNDVLITKMHDDMSVRKKHK